MRDLVRDPQAPEPVDRLSWAEVRRLALQHKKKLWIANGVAVLATLCSVPIPLLLPLLVDEVLLGHGDAALKVMNHALPAGWQSAAGYIGLMLLITLMLRCSALLFNVLQARLFAGLAKDIVYRIRLRLIERLKRISLGEYESLGSGTVTTHLVTDLDTLDKFVGETLSRFLVAMLTLVGTAGILMWMHWQLALLILLFNPLVIYATVQLGKRVKHLKKLENDSTSRFTQALTETLDAIQEVRAGNRQGFSSAASAGVPRMCGTTRWLRSGRATRPIAPVGCCSSSGSISFVRRPCSPCCFPTCPSARCWPCSATCGS